MIAQLTVKPSSVPVTAYCSFVALAGKCRIDENVNTDSVMIAIGINGSATATQSKSILYARCQNVVNHGNSVSFEESQCMEGAMNKWGTLCESSAWKQGVLNVRVSS